MKVIKSFKQATLRALFILISMPAVTWAGVKIDNTLEFDTGMIVKIVSLFLASFCGGVSSLFVNTSFDQSMKNPRLAKIWIGTFLGAFSGLIALDYFNFGIFTILLPTFFVASLGAPIMVFYLMWLSDPETQAEIKESIKAKARSKLNMSDKNEQ